MAHADDLDNRRRRLVVAAGSVAAALMLCAACTSAPSGQSVSQTRSAASASATSTGPTARSHAVAPSQRTAPAAPSQPAGSSAALGSSSAKTTASTGATAQSSAPAPSTSGGPTPSLTSSTPSGGSPLTPWPTYHGDLQRSGRARASAAPAGSLHARTVPLDGAVYASPIVADGSVIVATENDSVYALGPTGDVRWHVRLGTPTPQAGLPCGNIDPLGITGTPYYDYASDTLFAVTSTGPTADHTLVALDPATGHVRWRRSVDLPGVDHTAMQQRGALTVAGGKVWVAFGGLAGDCGDYLGRVVGVPVGDGPAVAFTVPTGREGGIWTPPGPTVDGGDLLVAVGNGASTGGRYDHSDSVLRLRGTALIDSFSPSTWASDNASDRDLGSQGPAVVQGGWVFQVGKSGIAYVLQADHLGGIGGQVSSRALCPSYGGTAVTGDVVYVPCTDGLAAVRIGDAGAMTVLWRAAADVTGSPVTAGHRVYALDPAGGTLAVLDAATGKRVQSVTVGACNRFATPAISGGRIYVGTLTGVAIVTGSAPSVATG